MMLAMAARAEWFACRDSDPVHGVVAGLAAALTIVALVIHLLVARWNRRFESRRCPLCNYDLRATPDRCPECGHEVTESEIPLPRWLNGIALDLVRTNTIHTSEAQRTQRNLKSKI
jgi:hypothetical protein